MMKGYLMTVKMTRKIIKRHMNLWLMFYCVKNNTKMIFSNNQSAVARLHVQLFLAYCRNYERS